MPITILYPFSHSLINLDDSEPYFRGLVAEFGYKIKEVYYVHEKRKFGKTHFNFLQMYDLAMLGITSYSKIVLRLATMFGFIFSVITFSYRHLNTTTNSKFHISQMFFTLTNICL